MGDHEATSFLLPAAAQAVLTLLHAEAAAQRRTMALNFVWQLPSVLTGRGVRFQSDNTAFYDDKLIPIGRAQGELLYLLARAMDARVVVEYGASFGVSSIYLAAAVRAGTPGGTLISTELVESKADAATENLREAGVLDVVELRRGDARETLVDLPDGVDMLLLDGWPTLALEILKIVEPRLRDGAMVVVDDVSLFKQDLAPIMAYCRDEKNGYTSTVLNVEDGFFIAVKGK